MLNILVAIERRIYWTWTFYIGAGRIGQAGGTTRSRIRNVYP